MNLRCVSIVQAIRRIRQQQAHGIQFGTPAWQTIAGLAAKVADLVQCLELIGKMGRRCTYLATGSASSDTITGKQKYLPKFGDLMKELSNIWR